MKSKKVKVKSKKLYGSSKSPDFKGSAFPSCCHSDTPDHEHSGRGEESHGPQWKTRTRKQEPGWQGKRKKAKVKSLDGYE